MSPGTSLGIYNLFAKVFGFIILVLIALSIPLIVNAGGGVATAEGERTTAYVSVWCDHTGDYAYSEGG